jgi:parallel beta-helix repeat protein
VKSFPNANVISHNYNQGILIVEGSSAEIIANKIEHNIKANIALGGEKTGDTRIMYNYILASKSGEGIFVVEGEKELLIEDNQIESNQDGIVVVNSQGKIKNNKIKHNTRSGVLSAGRSSAHVIGNVIEESNTGVLIKDPSELTLRKNEICKNNVQVEMERKAAKKYWTLYEKENPKIVGTKMIPQSTCNIF